MVDLRLIYFPSLYSCGCARKARRPCEGAEGLARCVTNRRGRAQVPDTTPGGATTALDALDSYQTATLWSSWSPGGAVKGSVRMVPNCPIAQVAAARALTRR